MDAAVLLAELLFVDRDRRHSFEAGLRQLSQDLTVLVPSWLAMAVDLVRLRCEIPVFSSAEADKTDLVRASLAVSLTVVDPGDRLILRAGDAGAFAPLADQLAGRPGPGQPTILVDQHLTWPLVPTGGSLAAALGDLRAVNQGIGILIDQGLPPEAARQELQRRADDADVSIDVMSRFLRTSVAQPAEPEGH